MELQKKHIKTKKVIAKHNNIEIHQILTFGGLQIIMMMKNEKPEILGAGAHIAHAKWEAEKKLKEKIQWLDE